MENVSNLLGKPVISIFNGTMEGYVKNILTDKKLNKILCLSIFDDESQEEKNVNLRDIFALDNDAIMIKNNSNVFLQSTMSIDDINPIGFKVFDIDGKSIGRICDILFDDKFEIKNLILQNGEFLNKKNIINIGHNLIIKNGKKSVKISSLKPKTMVIDKNKKTDVKVEIQKTNNSKSITTFPKKLTTGSEFLIGRKVGQNIYSDNKQLIIKKQSKITNQIVDIASKNGKLKELTSYSVI